jgi:hypothetical protein
MTKKPLVLALLLCAGVMTAISPATADSGYSASAAPTTGLRTGDTVTLTVSGLSGSLGVYASVCQAGATPMTIPTMCDQASTQWITSGAPGSTKSPAAITVQSAFDGKTSPSAATSTAVNCINTACVLYVRGDHNNSTNYSLIRTFPLTFTFGGRVRTPDTATARYGSTTLQPNQPGQLNYRTPLKLKVKALSGLTVTLTSLTPDCGVAGNVITALKGTGVCAIAATTKGSFAYAPLFVNFPFYLNPAQQTIQTKWSKPTARKVGTSVTIYASSFTTNMEQPVSLSTVSTSCTVVSTNNGWTLQFTSAGTCTVTARAEARADKWTAATASTSYNVH